jgi:predicted nucleic acid-binding protein
MFVARRKLGCSTAPLDLMIAAIARTHDATVVTRDLGSVEDCGVRLINPWQV